MTNRRINHYTLSDNSGANSFCYVPSGPTSGTAVYNAQDGTLIDMRTGAVTIVTAKEAAKNVSDCHFLNGASGSVYVRLMN